MTEAEWLGCNDPMKLLDVFAYRPANGEHPQETWIEAGEEEFHHIQNEQFASAGQAGESG